MLELVLVRHGETDSNVKGTYLGWTDIELNNKGLEQAYCVKQKLGGEKFDAIYSSQLKRAKRTAEIISEAMDMDITCCDDLKERNFGVWDNLTYNEITTKFPDEYNAWVNDHFHYRMSGGESSIDAYSRISRFIDILRQEHKSGKVLIVTHLGCIRKILSHLFEMGIEGSWRFRIDNCSISRVVINDEGYAYLTQLNA